MGSIMGAVCIFLFRVYDLLPERQKRVIRQADHADTLYANTVPIEGKVR